MIKRTDVRTVVPAYYPKTFGSRLDWAFLTEPQAGLNSRRIAWPRGKTLGGSGAINAMIYMQAAPSDFNRWAETRVHRLGLAVDRSIAEVNFNFTSLDAQSVTWSLARSLSRIRGHMRSSMPATLMACNAKKVGCKRNRTDVGNLHSYSVSMVDVITPDSNLQEMMPNASLDLFRGATVQSLKVNRDRVQKVAHPR